MEGRLLARQCEVDPGEADLRGIRDGRALDESTLDLERLANCAEPIAIADAGGSGKTSGMARLTLTPSG